MEKNTLMDPGWGKFRKNANHIPEEKIRNRQERIEPVETRWQQPKERGEKKQTLSSRIVTLGGRKNRVISKELINVQLVQNTATGSTTEGLEGKGGALPLEGGETRTPKEPGRGFPGALGNRVNGTAYPAGKP